MAKAIKTDEERARLDELFAQVEKELYGIEQEPVNQHVTDVERCRQYLEEKKQENASQTIGNVNQMIRDKCFKTKREEYLANAYKKLYDEEIPTLRNDKGNIRTELEHLRNFAKAVEMKLDKAEKTAKEQDNHHYYKMCCESIRLLMESL